MSDRFPIQNILKQGTPLSPLFFIFAVEYAIKKVKEKPGRTEIKWDISASGLC
jgi:hypothetical protein